MGSDFESAVAGWRKQTGELAKQFNVWHADQAALRQAPLLHMRKGAGFLVSLGRIARQIAADDAPKRAAAFAEHMDVVRLLHDFAPPATQDDKSLDNQTQKQAHSLAAIRSAGQGYLARLTRPKAPPETDAAVVEITAVIADCAARYIALDALNGCLELSLLAKTSPADYANVRQLIISFSDESGKSTPVALATQTLQDLHPSALARVNRAVTHHEMYELSKLFRFPLFGRNGDYFNLYVLELLRDPSRFPTLSPGMAVKVAVLAYAMTPEPVFAALITRLLKTVVISPQAAEDVKRGFAALALHDRPPAPHLIIADRANDGAAEAVAQTRPPLKIAVCLSGQMRGFRRAAADLDRLGLGTHDTQFFVHTWENVGRRAPDPEVVGTVERVFASAAFCKTYLAIAAETGAATLRARYPQFHDALAQSSVVTAEDIRAIYGPDTQVCIDREAEAPFDTFSNQEKMHYKIWAAHHMATAAPTVFDLVIRLRPDKPITSKSAPVDWHALHALVATHPVVFTEEAPGLRENLVIGDQFAVGTPAGMGHYADTWVQVRDGKAQQCFPAPAAFQGHTSLGFALFHAGYRVRRMPWILFGRPQDESQLTADETRALLALDMAAGAQTEMDKRLLQSLAAG